MKDLSKQFATRVKTKGRFVVDIPTNGKLNRNDTRWAKLANPDAFKL